MDDYIFICLTGVLRRTQEHSRLFNGGQHHRRMYDQWLHGVRVKYNWYNSNNTATQNSVKTFNHNRINTEQFEPIYRIKFKGHSAISHIDHMYLLYIWTEHMIYNIHTHTWKIWSTK